MSDTTPLVGHSGDRPTTDTTTDISESMSVVGQGGSGFGPIVSTGYGPTGHSELVDKHNDWERRLGDLAFEMQEYFGPAGEGNPGPLDMAVHVAFHVAREQAKFYREALSNAVI